VLVKKSERNGDRPDEIGSKGLFWTTCTRILAGLAALRSKIIHPDLKARKTWCAPEPS
jgi:hypothetical protein